MTNAGRIFASVVLSPSILANVRKATSGRCVLAPATFATWPKADVENTGDFIYNDDDKTFNIWDADAEVWRNPYGVLT